MSYDDESKLPALEKVTLAWAEPSQRLVLWTLDSGAVYKKTVEFFVINVKVDSTDLTEGSSPTLSAGQWYFDPTSKTLYTRMSDDSNPENNYVSCTYRIYFADAAINLPYDLATGIEVHYDPYIDKIGDFPVGIDNANQSGIALESRGSINFKRNDFFVDYFDTLIWENKAIKVFSYLPSDDSHKTIFSGKITDKSYSKTSVSFRVADFISNLTQTLAADLFDSDDGSIADSVIGNPKRTLYGRVNGVKLQSVDQTLAGYDMTGTLALTAGSASIVGTGTSFLSELSPEDEISLTYEGEDFTYRIDSIASDASATLTEESEFTDSGLSSTIKPEIPYRENNRVFHVAGHKLRAPSTTVIASGDNQLNRIEVADVSDIFPDDLITIGSDNVRVKRITGDVIVLNQNLDSMPSGGTSVDKNPIERVYYLGEELFIERDWTVTNTTEAKITLNSLAEFNATRRRGVVGTIAFNSGSRDLVGTNTIFKTQFKPRDWIISGDTNHQVWYEILEITDETNMKLRVAYGGGNLVAATCERKTIDYIGDESIVTCNCMGKEDSSGNWIKTASDVVKDLLIGASIPLTALDSDSFIEASVDADFPISLKLPLEPMSNLPTVRDSINLINKSVFGSLITKNEFLIAYEILTPDKPAEQQPVTDSDIRDYSISTKTDIWKKVTGQYRHQDSERYTNEASFSVYSYENEFVTNIVEGSKEVTNNLYLYNTVDVTTMIQRMAFYHSLTQSIIKLNGGGLFFSDKDINDKIYFELEHLYKRFGADSDQAKMAIISKVTRTGLKVDLELTDLGNIFNRVANIADDSSDDFSTAQDTQKIINGYIVDDNTELPDSSATTEDEWGANLIG